MFYGIKVNLITNSGWFVGFTDIYISHYIEKMHIIYLKLYRPKL